jgi:hypothetical protein
MHRPERWGYVQFVRDTGAGFVADDSWPVREALMEVYYAQAGYRKARGRWAEALGELSLPPFVGRFAPRLDVTPAGYQVSIERQGPGRTLERYFVNQESRLWKEVPAH